MWGGGGKGTGSAPDAKPGWGLQLVPARLPHGRTQYTVSHAALLRVPPYSMPTQGDWFCPLCVAQGITTKPQPLPLQPKQVRRTVPRHAALCLHCHACLQSGLVFALTKCPHWFRCWVAAAEPVPDHFLLAT